MILKIPALQIPQYWELIKFAGVKAEGIKDKNIRTYAIDLLFNLLDGTDQVILSFNEDKSLNRVLIYSFYLDPILDEKVMFFKALYSFNHASDDNWQEESLLIYAFAKKEECKVIKMQLRNANLIKIVKDIGGIEDSVNYSINL